MGLVLRIKVYDVFMDKFVQASTIATDLIIELIVAIIVSPLLLKFVRVGIQRWRNRKFERGFKAFYQIHDEAQSLCDDTNACKVLILRAENGGGVPKSGKNLHVTAVVEILGDPDMLAIREHWQHRLVDYPYVRMTMELYLDGYVVNRVDKLEKYCTLRGVYELSGIKTSYLKKIGIHDSALYYLSVAWTKKDKKIDSAMVYKIETVAMATGKLLG